MTLIKAGITLLLTLITLPPHAGISSTYGTFERFSDWMKENAHCTPDEGINWYEAEGTYCQAIMADSTDSECPNHFLIFYHDGRPFIGIHLDWKGKLLFANQNVSTAGIEWKEIKLTPDLQSMAYATAHLCRMDVLHAHGALSDFSSYQLTNNTAAWKQVLKEKK